MINILSNFKSLGIVSLLLLGTLGAKAVTFYLPEVKPLKEEGFTEVIISGKAVPGATVLVHKDKIPYITKENQVELINLDLAVIDKKEVTANEKGYFELHLKLPNEQIQLPLMVREDGKENQFQVNLAVTGETVRVEDEDKLERSFELRKKFGAWFGFGYNYLNYSQDSTQASIDVSYESFKGPTYLLLGKWWISDIWETELAFKVSPGSVTGSTDTAIDQGDYNWTIITAHGTYYDPRWRPNLFGKYKSRIGMIFGVQQHMVPFLVRTSAGAGEVKTNSMSMLAAGGKLLVDKGRGWGYEVFMRAQIPLTSGSVFNVNPRMAFDGSVGAFYNFPHTGLKAGVFWYGQYHQYSFTTYDVVVLGNIAGNQALLFSTLEGRVGWEF